jgi:hypothetical protein
MLRPTVSRPVCLGIKHPSGSYDQIFITVRQLLVCWCGALSLTKDGSVVYNCSWPLPVQTFSGPTPMGLVTTIYCLRFETSLFVASYDSQGYGGGIRPRLHTGVSLLRTVGLRYISLGTDRTENAASNNSSIVVYVCFGHYLATAIIYRAIT